MNYERRNRRPVWEVIDVELAHAFECETREGAEAFCNAIELVGHADAAKHRRN